MAAQDNTSQSYLSRLSPWSRSPIVPPVKGKEVETESSLLQQRNGTDHAVNHRHRLSLRSYPRDCPPLRPQWFHAVDVPKRKPHPAGKPKVEKPLGTPKKYAPFSTTDSKAIEAAFQDMVGEEDSGLREQLVRQREGSMSAKLEDVKPQETTPNVNLEKEGRRARTVPVNEDYLFDVDIEERELAPAYWLGPVYDVRRGTWFYQDGSVPRPCDENLAAQLEEGYLKARAWRLPAAQAAQARSRASSTSKVRPLSWAPGEQNDEVRTLNVSGQPSNPDLRKASMEQKQNDEQDSDAAQEEQAQNTHRLFGAHMNSTVTYQDATTAWLITDDFMSRMNYTVYQRFAGGGHFGGVKLIRGYVLPTKKSETKDPKPVNGKSNPQKLESQGEDVEESIANRPSTSETRRLNLQRQMSSLLEESTGSDAAKQDEEIRKRDEREIEDDYRETEGDDQGRDIDHLILVTHGIGQRLGLRLESVNFVHDVNTLRKTLKAVYADSPDLRALNSELGESDSVNSRVQVLPICWRHLLDFPKQSLRHNRKEHDIADTDAEEEEYPTLEDISVDGVPAVRNLITDLALDILIYDSPAYKEHISRIVLKECNRIYHLFKERHPAFNGKISLIGHSLGSVIMFEILCRQDASTKNVARPQKTMKLDFEVEDFYALGSPIGLFQMLNGRSIAARTQAVRNDTSSTSMDDPMLGAAPARKLKEASPLDEFNENPTSKPKCAQIYNIFHPTDPISYRIEPLISTAMSSLKPQPLPYTKRGIFGAPLGHGLTGISNRVSQSVSSMWSSMASSLLTRGLGYADEPKAAAVTSQIAGKTSTPLSLAAGTNVAGGVVASATPLTAAGAEKAQMTEDKLDRMATETELAKQRGQHPPTLIDAELETLYGGFEKQRLSISKDAETRDLGSSAELDDVEERGKKLRREEEKVRRLNSNGRVDYAIQEGAFDINLIAAIASHLSYWSDEDVSHFLISQLLSRHRVPRPRATSDTRQSSTI